jgi:nitrate/nitrite transporter NarK
MRRRYFDVSHGGCCSARWRRFARRAGLTATEQGLMVAVPLLGGSLFRPLLGTLGDRSAAGARD